VDADKQQTSADGPVPVWIRRCSDNSRWVSRGMGCR
jgi:hypothetical protein